MADPDPNKPAPPKGKAVGDEDPDFSPMDEPVEPTEPETQPMTRRGKDGRAHKVNEAGMPPEEKEAVPFIDIFSRLRGSPD